MPNGIDEWTNEWMKCYCIGCSIIPDIMCSVRSLSKTKLNAEDEKEGNWQQRKSINRRHAHTMPILNGTRDKSFAKNAACGPQSHIDRLLLNLTATLLGCRYESILSRTIMGQPCLSLFHFVKIVKSISIYIESSLCVAKCKFLHSFRVCRLRVSVYVSSSSDAHEEGGRERKRITTERNVITSSSE